MSMINYDTEQLNSIKKMRRRGFINNEELEELKEFNERRIKGALNKDDFLDIKELYKLKFRTSILGKKFQELIELYKQKSEGFFTKEVIEDYKSSHEYCATKLYKLKFRGCISADEFKELRGFFIHDNFNEDEQQELFKFYTLNKNGKLSDDDFICLKDLYKMNSFFYYDSDHDEFLAIIELYKQKINGVLTDNIIKADEDIPEYTITRLYKLKLLGRISLDKFEIMKKHFKQNDLYGWENELNKEDTNLLLFLLENGPEK